MLETRAVVVQVEDDLALVEALHEGGCGQCGSVGACGSRKLGEMLCRAPRRFRVHNPLAARVGDEVSLTVPAGLLWRSARTLYLLPLAGLFAGSLLAGQWATTVLHRDAWAVLGAVVGLCVGLLLARWLSRREQGMAVIAAVLPARN